MTGKRIRCYGTMADRIIRIRVREDLLAEVTGRTKAGGYPSLAEWVREAMREKLERGKE